MIELEKTYLLKEVPDGLLESDNKEIIDLYLPGYSNHPQIRLRKNGDTYELTKKRPVSEGDASEQTEETIILTKEEFEFFGTLDGKKVHKIRYYYNYNGHITEIDVFKGELEGLVVVDFEFESVEDKDSFKMPSFCLVDVTQEKFIAGGMLAGKSYQDIESDLNRLSYSKVLI